MKVAKTIIKFIIDIMKVVKTIIKFANKTIKVAKTIIKFANNIMKTANRIIDFANNIMIYVNSIIVFGMRFTLSPAPNMGLLTTPAAGATQGLTASPIRYGQVVERRHHQNGTSFKLTNH